MKSTLFSIALLLVLSSFTFNNNIEEEYFDGKWNVTIYGTPQGDATIPMRFETTDGVTTGYFIGDPSGQESSMDNVTITDGVLNCAFFIAGYDVTLSLEKVDDDNSAGSLMGMFSAEGVRVKD